MKKYVPSKQGTASYKPPWLTTSIRRMCRKKQRQFTKAKKSGRQAAWDAYKETKRNTLRVIRKARVDYINNILSTGLDQKDTKPLWKFFKSQRQDSVGIAPLKSNGKLHTNDKEKSDILNRQFQSVFTQEPKTDVLPTPGDPSFPKINELNINPEGVLKLLQGINTNKASGPDNIPCRILKELSNEIAPCIATFFTQTMSIGSLPHEWGQANICPIFKKGNRNEAANYRPVSLTCVLCKIMEHIVCKHIRNHLDKHNILSPLQHGFRHKHSCETQLLITTNDLLMKRDKNVQIDVAILDFSKAFDTVPHRRLQHKLAHYGIDGPILTWISQFLTKREQKVVVGGVASDPVHVDSGVPQGTVLGPLLFLLHINDLPRAVTSSVRLFADDCLLYREVRSPRDQHQLQEDLDSLMKWGSNWGMRFNPSKCTIMRIARKRSPLTCFYNLAGQVLQETSDAKYLGLNISNDLSWANQTSITAKRGNSVLGFIRRNLHNAPSKAKELAYEALVRSTLEYGATIWDPSTKQATQKIEMVQRRAARFVTNKYKRTQSVTELLDSLGWRTLQDRREEQRITLMFKIYTGAVAVPVESVNLESVTTSTRRKNSANFKIIRATTNEYKHSAIPRTIAAWNNLPQQLIEADTVKQFKVGLKSLRL